jgi:hypothetical protein
MGRLRSSRPDSSPLPLSLTRVTKLDAYLAELEAELGPTSDSDRAEAPARADLISDRCPRARLDSTRRQPGWSRRATTTRRVASRRPARTADATGARAMIRARGRKDGQ